MTETARIPSGVRAVFFDAVGTLLHPEPPAGAVYAAVGRRFGSRLDPGAVAGRFRAAFRRQEEQDHGRALRTDEAHEVLRWRAIVAEVLDDVTDPEACFRALYEHFAGPAAWRCDPGAAAVLRSLAGRGYTLGIASNFDERLRGLVAALPGLEPVQYLVISSEVGRRKPAAAFFREVCRGAGLPPEAILFVGDDAANDYAGARAAGLHALLLDPRHEEPVPDEARIRNLADLVVPAP